MRRRSLPVLCAATALALVAATTACSRDKEPAADTAGAAEVVEPVDTAPDTAPDSAADTAAPGCPPAAAAAGTVRARTLGCEADAPVGGMAAARVGDLVLENAKARFVVRTGQEGHAVIGLRGGNVVDAVRVGADGKQRGVDGLREWVPTVGFHLVQPDQVEVVEDGKDGVARVRVAGPLVAFPMIQELLQPEPPEATVVHEYVLRPDETALEIRTTITPSNGKALDAVIGDVTFWGGELGLYLPGAGQGSLKGGKITTIGLVPVHADELIVPCAGGFDAPVSILNTSGILGFLQPSAPVPAAGQTVVRRLAVGGEGRQDLAAAMAAAKGAGVQLATLEGTVAGMWPGVEVEVLDAKGGPLTRCRPDAQGKYGCPVPVTAKAARVLWIGNGNGEEGGGGQVAPETPHALQLQPGQTVTADLQAPQPAKVELDVRDAAGKPIPFRLQAIPVSQPAHGDRTWYDPDGAATVLLPAGTWDLWLHHGPEWSEHHANVELQAGKATAVKAQLEHVLDTDGWIAADMHVHAEHSSDSSVPNQHRLRNAVAEGLDYAVATDHDFVTDYTPWLLAQGLQDQLTVASGVEVSTLHLGHFNAWPLTVDENRSGNGAIAWFGKEAEALIVELRGKDPKRVVQSNHPRGSQSYFEGIDLDPATTDAKLLAFDAVEVINSKRMGDTPEVLADWFGLHTRGLRITGTANSDTHALDSGIGSARTWIWLGQKADGTWRDRQGQFTAAEADVALKAGRAVASTGPLLVLEIEGADGKTAAIGDTLVAKTGALQVRAHIQAPAWMPLGTIEIYRDGKVVHTQKVADTAVVAGKRVAQVEFTGEGGADAWWLAIHKPGAGATSPGQKKDVWAITNAVYVDGDGDGKVGK